MRLDLYLLTHEFFTSRQKAIDAIKNNQVSVNNKINNKPSTLIDELDQDLNITIINNDQCFVSRAGFKLFHALKYFNIDMSDKVILDIGSSTGGFTDCCLQNGASKVFCVDVGTNQLVDSLRLDKRITLRENTNARNLKITDFNVIIDFICVDVSFISIKLLIPIISDLLKTDKEAVLLIKPQFEVGRRYLNKNGIVKDKKQEKRILTEISALLFENNLIQSNYIESPIKGREGNTEYLVYIIKK